MWSKVLKYLLGFVVLWLVAMVAYSIATSMMGKAGKADSIMVHNAQIVDTLTPQGDAARILVERGQTLSLAESCTGGALANCFVSMPGTSRYFHMGLVCYSNESKASVLGVNARDIEKYGPVSQQVVEQMALGMQRLSGSQYVLATTGIAGPTGGTEALPRGTVWIALAGPSGKLVSKRYVFKGNRIENLECAVEAAVSMLLRSLHEEDN